MQQAVRQAVVQDAPVNAQGGETFIHRAAGPTLYHVFLNSNQQVMGLGQAGDQVLVQRFHKTHVGNRRAQFLARFQRRLQYTAESKDGNFFALPAHLPLSQRQRRHLLFDCRAGAGAPWITHRRRLVQ